MPELKYYGVFIGPLHLVRMQAHELRNERGVLVAYREEKIIAEFTTWAAWLEEDTPAKEPGTVLSMVRNGQPPAPEVA